MKQDNSTNLLSYKSLARAAECLKALCSPSSPADRPITTRRRTLHRHGNQAEAWINTIDNLGILAFFTTVWLANKFEIRSLRLLRNSRTSTARHLELY